MKKSRNFTWLIIGVITIILGIVIPLLGFNSSLYYEYSKDAQADQVTFYVIVTSKDEIKDLQNAIVNIKYEDGENEEYEVYFIKQSKVEGEFKYEFKVVETDDWEEAKRLESVKLRTIDGVIDIDKKVDWNTKIPVMIFCCVIGAFMIVVNFVNNNSKNRVNELKEIIASSAYDESNSFNQPEIVEEQNEIQELIDYVKEELKDDVKEEKIEEPKACEYCGSLSDADAKVCKYCGAKFKKK